MTNIVQQLELLALLDEVTTVDLLDHYRCHSIYLLDQGGLFRLHLESLEQSRVRWLEPQCRQTLKLEN